MPPLIYFHTLSRTFPLTIFPPAPSPAPSPLAPLSYPAPPTLPFEKTQPTHLIRTSNNRRKRPGLLLRPLGDSLDDGRVIGAKIDKHMGDAELEPSLQVSAEQGQRNQETRRMYVRVRARKGLVVVRRNKELKSRGRGRGRVRRCRKRRRIHTSHKASKKASLAVYPLASTRQYRPSPPRILTKSKIHTHTFSLKNNNNNNNKPLSSLHFPPLHFTSAVVYCQQHS